MWSAHLADLQGGPAAAPASIQARSCQSPHGLLTAAYGLLFRKEMSRERQVSLEASLQEERDDDEDNNSEQTAAAEALKEQIDIGKSAVSTF